MSERRELILAPTALNEMERCLPTEAEREALIRTLTALTVRHKVSEQAAPVTATAGVYMGYPIFSMIPVTYRLDAGRFRIHYRFDDHSVQVGFIGVY